MKQDETQNAYLPQNKASFANAENLSASAGGDAASMMPPAFQFNSSEMEEGEKEDTEKERNDNGRFQLEVDSSGEAPPEERNPTEAFELNDATAGAEEGASGNPNQPNDTNGTPNEEKPTGAFVLNPNAAAETAPATEQTAFVFRVNASNFNI